MKAYKGFNENLQCTSGNKCFQYEIGKTYEEPEADLCNSGFHACKFLHQTFQYYAPGDSRYCEVELEDVDTQSKDDVEIVGRKITILSEIPTADIAKTAAEICLDNAEDYSVSNAGDYSVANAGDCGAANAGYWGMANAGSCSVANVGSRGVARVGGYGVANAGKFGVAISMGIDSKLSGKKGSLLAFQIYENGNVKDWKTAVVDGVTILEDTYYILDGSEIVKAGEVIV